ncbi:MAG: helix-turn-helix domain-containing protein [Thermoanaerobaculia bacterium]|nr:helix-turn-helix domain-containing protein [Thermoanaerobaculia bacterium]
MEEHHTIGMMLRQARRRVGLSLEDVASKADLSISTLSRMETGRQSISVETLISLAQILGVDPAALVGSAAESSESPDPLLGRLRALDRKKRIEFWTQLTESAREDGGRITSRSEELRGEVDELLAQIDYIRAEMESVKSRIR